MTTPTLAEYKRDIAARMEVRDWSGAAAAAAACRSAWPADASGWLLGSFVALLTDQKEAALALVDERLTVAPRDLACLVQRAECLWTLGRRPEALGAAEAAAEAAGDEPAALDAVAAFFVHATEHARALALYDRALAAAPTSTHLRARRATLHRYLGAFDLAALDYQAVLAVDAADTDALKALGELRRGSPDPSSVAALEAALARNPTDPKHAAPLHFALAKAYEDLGDYAASWRHVTAANGLERTRIRYSAAVDRAAIDSLIEQFPGPEPVTPDTTGESPIFIVGLPRTGTTLVERILGSHSQVHSAGELDVLSEAITAVIARDRPPVDLDVREYTRLLAGLDAATLAAEYVARVKAWRGDRPRFSDKQVTNFFYCPLILRAFPQARIVHLTRHPLAACYAVYKTQFTRGFAFSCDLGELADFYLGYRKLMAHWHRILPGRILDLGYEDVVTAQEPTTRTLLAYCGLPFEAACLDFHANPAASMTASAVQVRQPLYDSSLEQWRHYEAGLAPLRERLEAAGIRTA
jgi:tetratricopeptide (TPR) repeat protein